MLTFGAYKLACAILSVAISFSSVAASVQDKESKQSTAAGTVVRISEGALDREAVRKVEPTYPPIAKAARASGDVKLELNQFKEAADSYRQCLELEYGPYTSPSHYGLGMAHLKLGDKRSAMSEYHALKKNNDPLLAEQLLREINK